MGWSATESTMGARPEAEAERQTHAHIQTIYNENEPKRHSLEDMML